MQSNIDSAPVSLVIDGGIRGNTALRKIEVCPRIRSQSEDRPWISSEETVENVEVSLAFVLTNNAVLRCEIRPTRHRGNDATNLFEQVINNLSTLNVTTLVEGNLEELSKADRRNAFKQWSNIGKFKLNCKLHRNIEKIIKPAGIVVVDRLGISKRFKNGAGQQDYELLQPTPSTTHLLCTIWSSNDFLLVDPATPDAWLQITYVMKLKNETALLQT